MSESRGGWIRLHRSLARHHLWLGSPFSRGQCWVDLLMLANYHNSTVTRGNRTLEIRRGQVLTSIESLCTRWMRAKGTVRAWLLAFEKEDRLYRVSAYGADGGYTLLTIRNYEKYQAGAGVGLDGGNGLGLDGGSVPPLDRALDGALDGALTQYKKLEETEEGEGDSRAVELASRVEGL